MNNTKPALYALLQEKGAKYLKDYELLAIALNISTTQAYEKLEANKFSLRKTLLTTESPLAQLAKASAILEITARFMLEDIKRGDAFLDQGSVSRYLKFMLRDRQQEVFACMFLDNKNRLIAFNEMFFGTINSSFVHPREVLKRALEYNAAAVIFAHNHPSGLPEPSEADKQITKKLKDALALVDIRVLDHFIVGEYVNSMAAMGLI